MTQRVLIQGGANAAMSVSLPGYDVTTANLDQMAFDSRWSGHQFYRMGFIDSHNDGEVVYAYGETLPYVPIMVAYCDPNITFLPGNQYLGLQNYKGPNTKSDPDFWIYAVVYANSVHFRFNRGNQVGRLYFTLFKRVAG